MERIFVDRHHDGLLESLYLLFGKRLGYEVYTPIGLDWFQEGYWRINDSPETAAQFLASGTVPSDGTLPLIHHKAITLAEFRDMDWDIVLASLPQHLQPYQELATSKGAKFIFQVGNEWSWPEEPSLNVLASVAPRDTQAHAVFYHQEFDINIFHPTPVPTTKKIYSFINCIQEYPSAWKNYQDLKAIMEPLGWEFKAFGAQCPDGNINGLRAIADTMREATFIFHVKPGGDGFGHILHNAYSVGRPVITRKSDYQGQWGEYLLKPGTFLDLDNGIENVKNDIAAEVFIPGLAQKAGEKAAQQFKEVVDYDREGEEIKQWISQLK